MPCQPLRLNCLGAPLAACLCFAAYADSTASPDPASAAGAASAAAPPATRPASAGMPTVRLLMPRRAGDPILMVDENGIARELPRRNAPPSAKPAAPAARPVDDAGKTVPMAVAPTAPATPSETVGAPPAQARRASEVVKPARPGDLPDDERRRLAELPLPQLPTLDPVQSPAAAGTVTATAGASVAAGAGGVETLAAELDRANDRIGLGAEPLAKIEAAKTLAAAGKEAAALAALIGLNQELDATIDNYVVKRGEAMRQIAARPEVYGNANLWPLIWDANRAQLPDPTRLAEGQKLRLPRYPSAGAAAQAIARARAAKP